MQTPISREKPRHRGIDSAGPGAGLRTGYRFQGECGGAALDLISAGRYDAPMIRSFRDPDAALTTIKEVHMPRRKLSPVHPGEILLEEFLHPLGISQYRVAKDLSVPPRRIN